MRRLLVVMSCAALAFVAGGCGDDDAGTTPASASTPPAPTTPAPTTTTGARGGIAGQRFVARSAEGRELVDGTELELRFAGARLAASAGCNRISGRFQLEQGTLAFVGKPAVSMMACEPPALMRQEAWYIDWLRRGVDLHIDADTLTASARGVTVTYRREAATSEGAGQAPILGTTWELVSTAARGADPEPLPEGVGIPSLTIRDGRAKLFTGCNRGSAAADVGDDGFITFGVVATTRKACPGAAGEIETKVLAVLKDRVAAAFDGDGHLLLTNDGARLTFQAQ